MSRRPTLRVLGALTLASLYACGARTGLEPAEADAGLDAAAGATASGGAAGASGGAAGASGSAGSDAGVTCHPGEQISCGSDVGQCSPGKRVCQDGVFGDCHGAIEPVPESCNGLDDDCDGVVDNGFGIGEPCDGPDSDLCLDDVMTCDGCSLGPDTPEVCNGVDDNCNGIIDADCDQGDCQPDLLVTGSTPSSPSCIDFPVTAGSTGSIEYPCTGGPVTAVLGGISFTGSVTNGQLLLTASVQKKGPPDNCLWEFDHSISGSLSSGKLTYKYSETLLDTSPNCWSPCTETGTVEVDWQ